MMSEETFNSTYRAEIAAEASRLKNIQQRMANALDEQSPGISAKCDNDREVSTRSVFVGNISQSITAEELQLLFKDVVSCVNRVEIQVNRVNGLTKGFAYVEFAQPKDVTAAVELDNVDFHGRRLRVVPKRPDFRQEGLSRGRGVTHRSRGLFIGRGRTIRGRRGTIRGVGRGRGRSRGRVKRFIQR